LHYGYLFGARQHSKITNFRVEESLRRHLIRPGGCAQADSRPNFGG
jgi:hypothetical protein